LNTKPGKPQRSSSVSSQIAARKLLSPVGCPSANGEPANIAVTIDVTP